ncbi:MAG: DUF2625 family protein [Lachnospiraceae bacterium]|nr:DUF2625 family protein [Lachnospiraceae bacterium]
MDLWTQVKAMFERSGRRVKIYDGFREQGANDIAAINASPESVLGAVVLNSSGIVVDNWITILGQSSAERAGIADFCERLGCDFGKMAVVAVDVVGGVFAINLGRFEEDFGMVWYFAPDTISWESMEVRYSEFLAWVAQGDIDGFCRTLRWSGWEADVEGVDSFNCGVLFYPYLWAKECNIETASRKIVPLRELIGINLEFEKKFAK